MSAPNPVFLVHGIDDTSVPFDKLSALLRKSGRQVHAMNLVPNNGDAGIDELAGQLATCIDANTAAGQSIDLGGFSMGGLVARYYLQRLNGAERVRGFITIASPHNGTWIAFLRWNRAARQMRPGSDFIKDLNSDSFIHTAIRVTSIWTPFDLMILPAASSAWSAGQSVRVNVAAHALMLRDRRVLAVIDELLQ